MGQFGVAIGGPGTEGTGAGIDSEDGNGSIPYTPVDLCTAPFADAALLCSADGAGSASGTRAVQWADANKNGEEAEIIAVLEGNSVRLRIPCPGASAEGRWGRLADGDLAFVGRYMDPIAVGNGLPASVRVVAAKNEPESVGFLEVYGQFGNLMYGPTLVRRVEGMVRAADCPR